MHVHACFSALLAGSRHRFQTKLPPAPSYKMGKRTESGELTLLTKHRKRFVEDYNVLMLACLENNTFEFRVKDGTTAVFQADDGTFPRINAKKPSRSHRALYKINTKEYVGRSDAEDDFAHGKIVKMKFLRWMKPSTYKRFKAGKLRNYYKSA